MRAIQGNLLLQFSALGFAIMVLLAVNVGLIVDDEFMRQQADLQQRANAMVAAQATPGATDGSGEGLLDAIGVRGQQLRWKTIGLLGGGFVLLYGLLVLIFWRVWRAVRRQEFRFETVVEALDEALLLVDHEGVIVYANSQLGALLGYERDEMIGEQVASFAPLLDALAERNERGEGTSSLEVEIGDREGERLWVRVQATPYRDGDGVRGTLCAIGNITERHRAETELQDTNQELENRVTELALAQAELHRANEQLQHDAFHDTLTGTPNRALFMNRLDHAMSRYRRRSDAGYAVLFLDFDRFKTVNDSLGHNVGDALLVRLSHKLTEWLRPGDTLARLGGDEFTVLLEDVPSIDTVLAVAERVLHGLQSPIVVEGHEIRIGASIGIVTHEIGYDRPEEVLRDADLAMYRAKALGKGRFQLFTVEMRDRAMSLLTLENDLRRAIDAGGLDVHYQPIVDTDSEALVGVEALVRWNHPDLGPVSPAEFIPLAEESGLIVGLDRWVLREACTQVARWQTQFPERSLTLSVNLSGRQFAETDLSASVAAVLSETGFDPRDLRLEITESALLGDSEDVDVVLLELRRLGVRISIDDFGTGYSSLAYLQRFPVDTIKIDRAFITNMMRSPESAELVRTIITMAQTLHLQVVAEGVEEGEQLEQLRSLRCGMVQGFHFSRPVDAEALTALLAAPTAPAGRS